MLQARHDLIIEPRPRIRQSGGVEGQGAWRIDQAAGWGRTDNGTELTIVNINFCNWRAARLGMLLLAANGGALVPGVAAAPDEGVAVVIVYDTSGSMLQKVPDADGRLTPKYIIASRALSNVLDRLQAVVARAGASRPVIHAGLVVFQGDHAGLAVKCGPFDPQPIREWVRQHGSPQRGTPLGDAVRVAGKAVLESALPRKHVLVITDGINTQGPDPTVTMPKVQRDAARRNAAVAFHFVAFDVKAAEFKGVKELGATVVGAADERELKAQLNFIVEKKILLEEEEVPSAAPKTN
jgi:hypothetical protein